MVSQSDIAYLYNKIYVEMRKYIWSYYVVEALAELEISVYQSCPDIDVVRMNFYRLDTLIRDFKFDQESLKKVFDDFSDCINSSDTIYKLLPRVDEVIKK